MGGGREALTEMRISESMVERCRWEALGLSTNVQVRRVGGLSRFLDLSRTLPGAIHPSCGRVLIHSYGHVRTPIVSGVAEFLGLRSHGHGSWKLFLARSWGMTLWVRPRISADDFGDDAASTRREQDWPGPDEVSLAFG